MYEAASDLLLEGVSDAFEMSPKTLVWLSVRAAEKRREIIRMQALTGRVAQAEKDDFDKFFKSLS